MTGVKLWVDDERPAPEGWCGVETSAAAIDVLATHTVTEMSLDYTLRRGDTTETVLYWLENHPDRWPQHVHAHSSSSAACRLIEHMIVRLRPVP